jgi:tetratricopeptide (TPR) repeat protein
MKNLLVIAAATLLLASCSGGKKERAVRAAAGKTDFEIMSERITANPRDAEAWYRLADLYNRSFMYHEEVDALKKMISIRPDMGYAYMELGAAYNRLGENLRKAKKYFPDNPTLSNNLAVTYGRIGDIDEEITALKRAISLRPRYATARYNLGVVYLKKGERNEALKQYYELKKFDEGASSSLKKEIDKIARER